MNFTNATGGDLIGAVSQSLSPITQNILGVNNGSNFLTGLVLLIILAGFMYSRHASLELIGLVLYFATWGLVVAGMMPTVVFILLLIITAAIILMAVMKFLRK